MTARPVVALVTNLEYDQNYRFPGYPRVTINEDYHRSIIAAGGIPILIPPAADPGIVREQLVREQLALADGLLLAGGQDVDPARYGQLRGPATQPPSPIRDAFEFAALTRAREIGLPVLAICRGVQLLNVWAGGTLHQDLADAHVSRDHDWPGLATDRAHTVNVVPGSSLERAVGPGPLDVNSFHHQTIDRLGAGVRTVATAPDGTVEAVEVSGSALGSGSGSGSDASEPWALGIQWHPEMLSRDDAASQRLFGWLIERARARA